MSEKLTPSAEALNSTIDQARQASQEAGTYDRMTAFHGRELTEFMGQDRMNEPQIRVKTDRGIEERVTAELERGNKEYKAITETGKSLSGTGDEYHKVRVITHNEDGTTTERISKNPYLARKMAKSIGDRVTSRALEQMQSETDKAA